MLEHTLYGHYIQYVSFHVQKTTTGRTSQCIRLCQQRDICQPAASLHSLPAAESNKGAYLNVFVADWAKVDKVSRLLWPCCNVHMDVHNFHCITACDEQHVRGFRWFISAWNMFPSIPPLLQTNTGVIHGNKMPLCSCSDSLQSIINLCVCTDPVGNSWGYLLGKGCSCPNTNSLY